jgi:PAS domain S-box-containing protein
MSPSCFSVLGYDPEDLVGKRPAIFHPDDLEKVNKTLSSALNGAKGSDFEYRVITKNGETRWVSHSWSSILENGQVKLIVSVVRGITERKQLEDDLRSSEEKFRAISTSAMDAIILVDDTGKISYWNPAAERIFGYAKEEAVGKDMEKLLMPPQYHGFHSKSAMQSLENVGQTYGRTIEFKALRKDGTPVPIELSVSTFKLKNRRCLLGIIRDVSERKKMEAEIKQERDMLESITQNIGAGLVIISKDYRVLWANNATKRYTGDVDGKLCYTVLHSLDAVCTNCGVKKIFEGEPINAHEYSSTSIDGKPYWVEIIATPIKDKDGNVTAASELAVDITEKKRMQNELAKYSEKLEHLIEERTEQLKQTQAKLVKVQRLATIGELAAMVGHDLRNPLTGIRGATYYLKTKYGVEIDAKGKEMLKTIDECIDHSNKIINDLLEYSREMELDLTETSPKTLLSHSMSMLKIPENIQVIDATEAEPKIMADKAKINRVFVNIIKNAIDAMPNGGTLTVTSKAAEDNLAIAFTDNGIGMSEETLSKLGSPLFTTKSKGMGFGLSICKRIIEAHGGKISVESIIGKGTTVTVTIPINPETVTENEETSVFNEPKVSVLMPQKVETC